MSSVQSQVLQPLLRVQRLAQRFATIEGTRRLSQASEHSNNLPKGVTSSLFKQGNLQYEWLTPPEFDAKRVLYYLHGGGFVFPLWNPLRRVIAYIISGAKIRALAVHYRLAPENPFPAAIEDCVAGYHWLTSEQAIAPKDIVFMGESAGANLVVATLLTLRDSREPLPRKAAPLCGPLDLEAGGAFTCDIDPMANPRFVSKQILAYRGKADPRNPLLSPVYADLHGLPPLLIQVGSQEAFLDESILLARQARQAGVTVTLEVWPGMWHYWHLFVPFLPEARQAINRIIGFVGSA